MEQLENMNVAQIAIVVDDIERYLDAWARAFGIERPTWRLTETGDQTNARYMGQATAAQAKLAFIRFANLSLEVIEPVGAPSTWADFLQKRGPGVHHIAFRTSDKTPIVQKLGLRVTQTGDFKGGNYTYLDGEDKLGVNIEILEMTSQKPAT